jgi:hypothetical protein
MDKGAFIKENNTNLIKTTLNDLKYIKSIVIFTAEESNSLTNLLENAGYAFVPVIGEYNGNQDNLYAVFNLSFDFMLRLIGTTTFQNVQISILYLKIISRTVS